VGGAWDNRGYFSLYYLISKRRWGGILVGRGQSAEYRVQTTEKYKINISHQLHLFYRILFSLFATLARPFILATPSALSTH